MVFLDDVYGDVGLNNGITGICSRSLNNKKDVRDWDVRDETLGTVLKHFTCSVILFVLQWSFL